MKEGCKVDERSGGGGLCVCYDPARARAPPRPVRAACSRDGCRKGRACVLARARARQRERERERRRARVEFNARLPRPRSESKKAVSFTRFSSPSLVHPPRAPPPSTTMAFALRASLTTRPVAGARRAATVAAPAGGLPALVSCILMYLLGLFVEKRAGGGGGGGDAAGRRGAHPLRPGPPCPVSSTADLGTPEDANPIYALPGVAIRGSGRARPSRAERERNGQERERAQWVGERRRFPSVSPAARVAGPRGACDPAQLATNSVSWLVRWRWHARACHPRRTHAPCSPKDGSAPPPLPSRSPPPSVLIGRCLARAAPPGHARTHPQRPAQSGSANARGWARSRAPSWPGVAPAGDDTPLRWG